MLTGYGRRLTQLRLWKGVNSRGGGSSKNVCGGLEEFEHGFACVAQALPTLNSDRSLTCTKQTLYDHFF